MKPVYFKFFKYGTPLFCIGIILFLMTFGSNSQDLEIESSIEEVPEIKVAEVPTIYDQFGSVFYNEFIKSKCPGAAIAIIKDTSVVFIEGLGVLSSLTSDSVDLESVFRLGSVSKGFAGILTGKLIDKGYFDWNTKIQKHIPFFTLKDSAQAARMEVRHLLSHTTGLIRHSYTNLIEDGLPMSRITPMLKTVDLISKEGQMMSYQNVAFSIIEEFIESATNKDFNQLLKEEIFNPAYMSSASSTRSVFNETKNKSMPHRWSSKNQKYYKSKHNNKYYNAPSAGGINASISDMANWLQVVMGNRPNVVSEKALEGVFSSEIKTSRNRKYFNKWPGVTNSAYAKGWRKIEMNDRELMYHGGYVNQFRSEIAFDPVNKLGICVLFNAPVKYSSKVVPAFYQFCDSIKTASAAPQFTVALDSLP